MRSNQVVKVEPPLRGNFSHQKTSKSREYKKMGGYLLLLLPIPPLSLVIAGFIVGSKYYLFATFYYLLTTCLKKYRLIRSIAL
jgi:hypothetical protein